MKKRSYFIINLSVLVLAICVMAVGVYSLKQSKLNINGTVGFVAHNCAFAVSGNVRCANATDVTESGAEATIEDFPIARTTYQSSGDSSLGNSLDLGDLYFNDLLEDGNKVVITLNFENLSRFKVSLEINSINYTNGVNTDSIQYSINKGDETYNINRWVMLDVPDSVVGSGNDFATITITLMVDRTEMANISKISGDLNIGITFTKTEYEIENISFAGEDIGNTLTVNMGTNDLGNDMKWLAVAYDDGNGGMVSLINKTTTKFDATYATLDTTKKYYFIAPDSLKTKKDGVWGYGNHILPDTISGDASNNYGLNYEGSEAQLYLQNTLAIDYQISQDQLDKIIPVDVKYPSVIKLTENYEDQERIEKTVKNQYFWLLSSEQFNSICGEGNGSDNYGQDNLWAKSTQDWETLSLNSIQYSADSYTDVFRGLVQGYNGGYYSDCSSMCLRPVFKMAIK